MHIVLNHVTVFQPMRAIEIRSHITRGMATYMYLHYIHLKKKQYTSHTYNNIFFLSVTG